MPFEVKGYIPSVKPGAYPATLLSTEERSPAKDPTNVFRVWEFMISDGSQRTVDGSSSLASSPKSKGGKWLRAILGREPIEGEVVSPEGLPCTIIVAIKETTGYEYVETVAAATTTPAEAPQAPVAVGVAPEATEGNTTPEMDTGDDLPF